ncbi:C1 family peptidase [Mucisphaera calidilacus]|uniref:Aminopeptidase n=1 Tax=Mucisphaera calidilacus TaxID=2527982 RepID=A0A518BUS4_9BACT|nr:C1 family peptidase [Mucisphaera calidilacus]QDU70729.1 Aminopeptidase C [Mucisphaera calidilacus]
MTMTPSRPAAAETSRPLTGDQFAAWQRRFDESPSAQLMQNAVCRQPIDEVALDRRVATSTDFTFSHVLDDWTVTSQKQSGRCWLFAGLNLLRVGAMNKMNLQEFEFSQNHIFFWDKVERANYFLQRIIETADRDIDDRHVAFLLDRPYDDGGQWNMFVNLVKKHGLVPQAVMPDSHSSGCTPRMNGNIRHKLREGAVRLRAAAAAGASTENLEAEKHAILETVYRILSIHLGTPPAEFDWQWNDKDRKFHRDGKVTPQDFAKRYTDIDLDHYVCLVNDPRNPYNQTYTVEYLGNVEGGDRVVYLNVETDVLKQVAMNTITDGEPVWMGCDVGPMMERKLGLWDARLYDYEGVYETQYTLDKADRLRAHQSLMTHAMLFTGVDVVSEAGVERPRRWRVENSWGDEIGRKGFFLMNDNWFDQYMFEIAANRKYLSQDLIAALDTEPTVLPPWDPMGSLARS